MFDLGPRVCAPRRFEPKGVPFTQMPNGPIIYQSNVTFASVYDTGCDDRGYLGADGRIEYHINSRGMRGPEVAASKPENAYRVVCLGDSITFGEGVRYEDTYPAVLATILGERMPDRRVEVINAGVQGFGTNDAAAFFLRRCLQLKPDVVTLGFFLNDAMPHDETIRQNEAMMRDAPLSGLARASRIWEIVERSRRADALQGEYFASIRLSFDSEAWDRCRQVLAGMQQVAREDGFRFIVVLFPVLYELDAGYPFQALHQRIAGACEDAGCEFIDLLAVYQGHRAETLWVHPVDHHPNEIAHRLAAEAIASHSGVAD